MADEVRFPFSPPPRLAPRVSDHAVLLQNGAKTSECNSAYVDSSIVEQARDGAVCSDACRDFATTGVCDVPVWAPERTAFALAHSEKVFNGMLFPHPKDQELLPLVRFDDPATHRVLFTQSPSGFRPAQFWLDNYGGFSAHVDPMLNNLRLGCPKVYAAYQEIYKVMLGRTCDLVAPYLERARVKVNGSGKLQLHTDIHPRDWDKPRFIQTLLWLSADMEAFAVDPMASGTLVVATGFQDRYIQGLLWLYTRPTGVLPHADTDEFPFWMDDGFDLADFGRFVASYADASAGGETWKKSARKLHIRVISEALKTNDVPLPTGWTPPEMVWRAMRPQPGTISFFVGGAPHYSARMVDCRAAAVALYIRLEPLEFHSAFHDVAATRSRWDQTRRLVGKIRQGGDNVLERIYLSDRDAAHPMSYDLRASDNGLWNAVRGHTWNGRVYTHHDWRRGVLPFPADSQVESDTDDCGARVAGKRQRGEDKRRGTVFPEGDAGPLTRSKARKSNPSSNTRPS